MLCLWWWEKNILEVVDTSLYNYNIYYYLELDVDLIIKLRKKLIRQVDDLLTNINLTKNLFSKMVLNLYKLGDNVKNILQNNESFKEAKQLLLNIIRQRKIYDQAYIQNVDTNFENLKNKIERISNNIIKTIEEINELITSFNSFNSYYYNKIFNEIDKIFDAIKHYGFVFNQTNKDIKNYCFNKSFIHVETPYKEDAVKNELRKIDTNYYIADNNNKPLLHDHYNSINKSELGDHLEKHDKNIAHEYYFYKTSKVCNVDSDDINTLETLQEDVYNIKNLHKDKIEKLSSFMLDETAIGTMFETIENFYKYIINKSDIVVNNLEYNTYFEIFFTTKGANNIHQVFDESFR